MYIRAYLAFLGHIITFSINPLWGPSPCWHQTDYLDYLDIRTFLREILHCQYTRMKNIISKLTKLGCNLANRKIKSARTMHNDKCNILQCELCIRGPFLFF